MSRMFIVVGDATSGGGRLISGSAFTFVDGQAVCRIGDKATCPQHKGVFSIATGDVTVIIDGQAVARHGDKLACGCTLIAGQQQRVFSEAGGQTRQTHAMSHGETLALRPVPAKVHPASPASFARDTPAVIEHIPVAVTLRIGVFFDGTNNNAVNINLGQQCRGSSAQALGQDEADRAAIAEHCRPYMLRDGSSYDNGISNVARLHGLYVDNLESPPQDGVEQFNLRIYVDGIGTTAGQPDNLLSQGLGSGKHGVLSKVDHALGQLIPRQLTAFVASAPDVQVKAVEFDVFGFSRGAAAARHFVNQVNLKGLGPVGQALLRSGVRYAPGFEFVGGVQVGFVGLFDTVTAIGSIADGLNVRDNHHGGVQSTLPAGCARHVVHLVARDERRANFMLTTVAPEHREITLPGAHSDIGGGYHRSHEGPLLLEKPVGYIEAPGGLLPGQVPSRAQLERTRAYSEALAACQRWRAHLGLGDDALRVDVWHLWQSQRRPGSPSAVPDRVLRVYATVVLERRMDPGYQLIPLRVMHKLAVEAGVQWKQSPDDVPDYLLPPALEPIADKLVNGQALNDEERMFLRRSYLHQSAHWNFELASTLGRGPVSLNLIYISRPDPSGQREIKPNGAGE